MATLVHIDGSYGEGGGQIIRTSLSLSALTGQPVAITNIRAGRAQPGLRPQHLTAVHAAAEICEAAIQGDSVGSRALRFEPGRPVKAGRYHWEIGTAGATALIAQTVLLPLSQATGSSQVTITGGTHASFAPAADYLEAVYLPALRSAGVVASVAYERAGFYPRGGGELQLQVEAPAALRGFDLSERGKLTALTAYVVTSELPAHVLERGVATVEQCLKAVGRRAEIIRRDRPSLGPGAAVTLAAECEGGLAGFTALGKRGLPMEQVAQGPAEEFLRWWKTGAAVDEHLSDQLLLPAVLALGESRWTAPEATEHLRTAIWVGQQFLPVEAGIEENDAGGVTVTVRGG